MILVTGATGVNGRALVEELAGHGQTCRAMVRNPAKFGDCPVGVDVVHGDFDDPLSLRHALVGVTRAFLVTPSSERAEAQQIRFIEAAKHAKLRHLVILSQYAASNDSPVRFLRYHAVVENAAQASGIAWTILRPNLFMQGLLQFKDMIRATGSFAAAIGEAKVSVVDVRDIAAAACVALTADGHEDRIYDLTGPEALTHQQMAEALTVASGRPIAFHDVPEAAMADALRQAGMPTWQVEGLLEDYAHYRRNEAAGVSTGVWDASGHLPRSFATFAHDHAAAFRA
jgi:uncharacterized protein YbjT (DUF2867 family)